METVMERKGSSVKAGKLTASIPSNISMLAIFGTNQFISGGEYREDGWVYVGDKPVKKWFQKVEQVSIWEPILKDVHKLLARYKVVSKRYKDYWKKTVLPAFEAVEKAGKAHAKVTHNFHSSDDPWWFYTFEKYSGHPSLSWDWVKTPKKPINLKIGNAYYQAEQRLQQLGSRAYKFRVVLERAIYDRVNTIEGTPGQTLQCKVGDRIYWFQYERFSWEKLVFPEDDVKVVEL